jgi:hypothetical protein
MFVPVDRPHVAVVGQHLVHAAETPSVVATTAKGRRLAIPARWKIACSAPGITRLATVPAAAGAEPFASPWPPLPEALERYGPACPSCSAVAG